MFCKLNSLEKKTAMNDSDDRNSPVYTCHECGWQGHKEQMVDDGPGHKWCCPACGIDFAVG
jgi:predicted RNA-binding Zn-ribbon protein involved in translation (DUF1610 family)